MDHLLSLLGFCLFASALGNPLHHEPKGIVSNLALNNKLTGRIVGGTPATDGDFPYQVSLQKNGRHFCGGSIINSQWIMTAAHCLMGESVYGITVVVGTHNLKSGGEEYKAQEIIVHSNFSMNSLTCDIALLRIKGTITFSSTVSSIKLPPYDISKANENVIVSGWGKTSVIGGIPTQLHYLNSKIFDHYKCLSFNGKVSKKNLCTFTKPGEGLCNGDSGGPVVANGYQVGIVSWGYPCAIGSPDVHTRVYSYVSWIKDRVNL